MQMLYNSDHYVVVEFDLRPQAAAPATSAAKAGRGGYEIVDKMAGREIFIDGIVADGFREGVEALMKKEPSAEDVDEFIGRYAALANAPVTLH